MTSPASTTPAATPAPVTPRSGGWLVDLGMYRAMLAAGFTVSPIKSMDGRDGVAWQATLSFNGKKVLTASNDGNGGPDWVEPIPVSAIEKLDGARDAMKAAIDKLASLPEVITFLKAFEITVLAYIDDAAERKAKEEEVLASALQINDERVGHVVGTMAEIRKTLPKLKKIAATGMNWADAGDEFGEFRTLKHPDTPANRAALAAKKPERFAVIQGYLPDLIAGL